MSKVTIETQGLISKIYEIADGDSVKANQILDLILEERSQTIKAIKGEL